jgi:hypothetical protein
MDSCHAYDHVDQPSLQLAQDTNKLRSGYNSSNDFRVDQRRCHMSDRQQDCPFFFPVQTYAQIIADTAEPSCSKYDLQLTASETFANWDA